MTPFQTIEDGPRRVESWSTAMKILACSTAAMLVAVVMLAWYAASLQQQYLDRAETMCRCAELSR